MSWIEILTLLLSALAAGILNAVAGGGTLITFPMLVLYGVPPVIANATSTLSLVVGISGSVFGFRKLISGILPWLPIFLPVSLLGGLLGSILLTHGSERTFSRLVPWLVLFATILFMLQGFIRKLVARRAAWQLIEGSNSLPATGAALFLGIFFQFLVSVYGGYFGAGIGILMLAILGLLGFSDIHRMNALKTVTGGLVNLVSAVWFTASGLIDWPKMEIMMIGAMAGYYLGAIFSQRLSQSIMRRVITMIGVIITVVMFLKLR